MKNPRSLKVRRYAGRLIDLNEYLAHNMGVTELLNSIPNSWSKQAYVQSFDCETIYFKNAANMFERMEIAEDIYEGVVTPSY